MQLNKSEEELRCESDKVRRAMTTAEKVKEEKSDLSSELSGRDSEITLLKANEKRLVRDLAGTISNSLWKCLPYGGQNYAWSPLFERNFSGWGGPILKATL